MSDFSNWHHPIGRKDHRCEWCGQIIPKGEKHFQFTGVWESEWQNWRMHKECHESATLNDEMRDGFYPFNNERPKPIETIPTDRSESMETT